MIPARRGGPFTWVLDKYIERKLKTSFRGVWVRGSVPKLEDSGLLVYANHSNFWDGFVAFALAKHAGWRVYCAMEEENLQRYQFLSHLGAFSIRKGDGKAALQSLRYASTLLKQPRSSVFIFPEGELHAMAQTPHPLQRGVEVLARLGKVPCLPVAFRYVFAEHEYPDILIEVGSPHEASSLDEFTHKLNDVSKRVFAARSLQGFRQILAGRSGVNERWDAVRGIDTEGDSTQEQPSPPDASRALSIQKI